MDPQDQSSMNVCSNQEFVWHYLCLWNSLELTDALRPTVIAANVITLNTRKTL